MSGIVGRGAPLLVAIAACSGGAPTPAALGTRSSGGYTVSIDSVARGATLRAFVTTVTPGPDCVTTMAINWPVQVVRVPRFDGSVEFIEVEQVRHCR